MANLQTRAISSQTRENDKIDLNVLIKRLNNLHNSLACQYLTKHDVEAQYCTKSPLNTFPTESQLTKNSVK